jgi:hypothetical protein
LQAGDVPVTRVQANVNQNHGSLANQHGTHKFMTLPPLHIAGRVQFTDEANRGHVVVLHPVKKKKQNETKKSKKNPKKKKIRFHTGLWFERNEPKPL